MIDVANKKLFKFWSKPDYLRLPSVGLQICDDYISFVLLAYKNGNLILEKYGREELPDGVVKAGFINDKKKLVEILKEMKRKYLLGTVIVSLPEEKSYFFSTTIPLKKEKDIKEIILRKIEERLPMPGSDLTFDYHILNKEQDRAKVEVFVASLKILSSYSDILKQSGLKPLAFGFESQAFCKSIAEKDNSFIFVAVNLSRNKSSLYLIGGGQIAHSSTLAIGSNHILSMVENKINKKNESEKIDLKDEVEKLFSYARADSKDNSFFRKMLIAGDRVSDKGILDYFQNNFEAEIDLANVWTNVYSFEKHIPEIMIENSFSFAVPIGLNLIKLEKLSK